MITDFNIIFILVGLAPKQLKSCENYFGGLTYPSKSVKKYTKEYIKNTKIYSEPN